MTLPLQALGMLRVKPRWYLKSLHPTSTRHCVPCHPHHGIHRCPRTPLGEWKPQSRQQESPIAKPKPLESSPHQTTQPCKETSTAPLMERHREARGTPTTPQHPPPHRGRLHPPNPWDPSCIAALPPGTAALALRLERLVFAGLFHPPTPYCSPEPGPDPGYL